ncbi:gem (nuclear organelle) associated protein 2 [Puccinia graminis f. sp. tritici]|uniref:Gem (Nuclear organelle) associated protein 2 n=1 Tax=Puccinia graminis f. sp. tritici TaxID=56615 RepID=A0A5B0PZC6_PUCGR|nr:gem (nuclear organelle) associated protein 2 [Puccinia graminis f. sp. tritici]KAA1109224.1 gem (nuclear organelle) associated protein 2 [Puccinia graminis f. sp. tritici]
MDLAEEECGEWEYEEEEEYEEGAEEEHLPIGYTIEFSAEDREAHEEDGDAEQAPRGGLGSQALPVSDTLRADWDGIPTDGAEYLFTVRREARARPRIVAKENPYKLPSRSLPQPGPIGCKQSGPSDSWRKKFIERFMNMRQSLQVQEPWHWDLAEDFRRPPPDNDESNWKIFILGKKTNLKDYPARAPIPLFLKALEQATVIAVLGHYQAWIQERINALATMIEQSNDVELPDDVEDPSESQEIVLLSPSDGAWLMGLLAVLDAVLTSEDVFKLRELARSCKHVVHITNAALQLAQDSSAEQEAGVAWMVIAAVADIWGQKDLWDE